MKKVNALVLGLAVLLAACDKENDPNDPAPGSNVKTNCLLTKHVSTVNSSQSVSEFTYDVAGKLIRADYSFLSSPGGNSYVEVTYNPEGQVAKIMSFDKNNVAGNYKVFSYNQNNQPDTITNFRGGVNLGYTTYEYNASKQVVKWSVFTPHDSLSLNYAELTYPAANQSKVMRYNRNADGTATLDRITENLYDDKLHPYAMLGYFYEPLLFSQHNLLTSTIAYSGQSYVNNQTYAYEYNPSGYPVKQTITSGQSGSQTVNTFTYNCQ